MARKTNCTVHGKPMYRIRAQIGIDEHGRPVMKNFYGEGKKEAEARRDAWLKKMDSSHVDTDSSLGQLARHFTYNVLINSELAPGTIDLYESQYRKYFNLSSLRLRPIGSVTSGDIQVFFNQLALGKVDDETVSVRPSNVKFLAQYMKRLFKYLHTSGYCDNLMASVTVPRLRTENAESAKKDIAVFTDTEIDRIISTPNRKHFLFSLALASGLREGELLALRYSDFSEEAVHVNRQLNSHYAIDADGYREYTTVIKMPKSRSSIRAVPLPSSVLAEYEEYRKWHMKEMEQCGYETAYLFTSNTGRLLDKQDFRRAWRRHLKKAGVPYCKFHACRATYCTILCKNGVPLETASKLMGHSDINVTAAFYRLVSAGEMKSAVSKIDHIFSKPSGDKVATSL